MSEKINLIEDELKKELEYKIKSMDEDSNHFRVEVEHPDSEIGVQTFSFDKNSDWLETGEYIRNGEKREAAKWKIHVEKKIRQKQNSDLSTEKVEKDRLEDYEGKRLDL